MVKLNRLQRWSGKLDVCIRCGYCYEHCPVFKHTRWETDTPRAKLALLYGLLHGELEPSAWIAEKLFECFRCGRCASACSSGVPILEIFDDARADLLDLGFDPVGTTSRTDHQRCAKCLNCMRMCPHEARSFLDGKVVTDRLKCQSCGSCLDVCSRCGVTIRRGFGTNPDEQREAIADFLDATEGERSRVRAVVFSCSWSSFPGLQVSSLAGARDQAEYLVQVTACAGRLKSHLMLEALERGAWGVLVARCPEEECEHDGSQRARARVARIRGFLERLGVDPRRVQDVVIGKADSGAFAKAVQAFLAELREVGPVSGSSAA